MLPTVDVSLWAIIIAAVASMIAGSFWYSPLFFGNAWVKLMGFTKKDVDRAKKNGMTKLYFTTFVGSIVMAYVLAYLIVITQSYGLDQGIKLGAIVWLGFIVPVLLGSVLWDGKPVNLFLINIGYWLVNLEIMGAILSSWN
jgi:hypothetical protein